MATSARVLVLQHAWYEPPAAYGDVLKERDIPVERVVLSEGGALPDWREFGAVIAMGGPMSANDVRDYDWLAPEKRFISDVVGAGVPFWGVCLGAQLLACALGARVFAWRSPEVGVSTVSLTPAAAQDPVFGQLPGRLPVFQWHADAFDLPPGAVLLATSADCPNQAFRVGPAYGVQFHLEVTADLAAMWLEISAYARGLRAARGPGAEAAVLAELADAHLAMRGTASAVFGNWPDTFGPAGPGPTDLPDSGPGPG